MAFSLASKQRISKSLKLNFAFVPEAKDIITLGIRPEDVYQRNSFEGESRFSIVKAKKMYFLKMED